jgi:hypothetical protein
LQIPCEFGKSRIVDVLGHRCIDTTFIYAKADLKALREVVMLWPKKGWTAVRGRFGFKHFSRRVMPLVEMMRATKKCSDTWIAFGCFSFLEAPK